MRWAGAAVILILLPASASGGDGAVRAIARAGRTCWAAGDRGLLLRSDDDGHTWRRLDCPVRADFSAVDFSDADTGAILGGRCAPGHPGGATVGVIVVTRDGGKTLKTLPAPGLGALAGGRVRGARGVVFGRANWASPGGAWLTVLGGRAWVPIKSTSRGDVLGGAFLDNWNACLVGPDNRILLLKALAAKPQAEIASDAALTAVCYAGQDACWAVGENGSVYVVNPKAGRWRQGRLAMPLGTRRLADLEAVVVGADGRVVAGGGLTGMLFANSPPGRSLAPTPAPRPGPVHALAVSADGALLAGGDGGRIWRRAAVAARPAASQPAGWKLVHGPAAVDVLVISAPADVTVLPAVAAHAAAGLDVAMLWAAAPETTAAGGLKLRGDIHLRAAASAAGAGGAAVLTDLLSAAGADAAAEMSADDVLKRLATKIDSPAPAELLRQMVAAIRLYRPAVVARGPDGPGGRGLQAENRLISRLAGRAVKLAADPKAYPETAALGLRPWRVRRLYTGFERNERYSAPWERAPRLPKMNVAAVIEGRRYPRSGDASLSMTALRAAAMLPWVSPADRPAERTAYTCSLVMPASPLFTTGLSGARLAFRAAPVGEAIAGGSVLRLPAMRGLGLSSAVDPLLRAARAHPTDPLPVDLMRLLFARMLAEGDLQGAASLLRIVLSRGGSHPLAERTNFVAVAMTASSEWARQMRLYRPRRGGGPAEESVDFPAVVAAMSRWPLAAWTLDEPGTALLAHAQKALARKPQAAAASYRKILTRSTDDRWKSYAQTELVELGEADAATIGEGTVAAKALGVPRVDGRLAEPFWRNVLPTALRPAGTKPGGDHPVTARLAALPGHLAVAVEIGRAAKGRPLPAWDLALAIDADRDAWTQVVLRCDSTGRQSLKLLTRLAPEAKLSAGVVALQAASGQARWTVEMAMPYAAVARPASPPRLMRVQVRVGVAGEDGKRTVLYLSPQEDDRLLPHRYGLLAVPRAGAP